MSGPAQPGRIVHYVMGDRDPEPGAIRPAMLIRVWRPLDDEHAPGMSNLVVFLDGPNDGGLYDLDRSMTWRGSVHFDAGGAFGTWHWPPRE